MGLMHTQGIVLLSLALGGIQIQTLLLAATANRTASAPKAQRFETAILDPNPLPGIPTPPYVGDVQDGHGQASVHVSIHAPRVGGDPSKLTIPFANSGFNPRPPRGGRLFKQQEKRRKEWVSIHAPRVGGDVWGALPAQGQSEFQSTPPAWGATWEPLQPRRLLLVSIHAPRVGGDSSRPRSCGARLAGFNPRPPRGGRLGKVERLQTVSEFQSTPPAWGATNVQDFASVACWFQSTPPAWGATK